MAVSDKPWGQFSQADYDIAQWKRACLVDTGEGDPNAKDRYKLPVREPDGTLNRNAVHAAAGRIQELTGVSAQVKKAAARKLVGFYENDLGEEPPDALEQLAGMAGAADEPEMKSRRDLAGRVFVRAFDFESAGTGDGRTLEGYAAVFNRSSRIADLAGDFDEVIKPGAFTRSIQQRTPVLQFEHGRDPRVGAVPIGSIQELREDSTGLYVRARLFDNPVVEPVRQAIAGGAIHGMSFRFSVPQGGDTWSRGADGVDLREITDTDTRELGPVVFPAYDQTSVSVRSMLANLDPDQYRALIRELAAELRQAVDLSDFTGRPVTRSAGGGEYGAAPAGSRPASSPSSQRFTADGESLRLRGIIR